MLKNKFCGRMGLFILELIIILILLPKCFREEELVEDFSGEDIREQTIPEDGYEKFCSEKLHLKPGVYQVRVWSQTADGQHMYVQVYSDQASYKSLRNNGTTLYAGSEYDEFEVYVLDTIDSAHVQCDFYNTSTASLMRLELWRTNMGSRMLLFVSVASFLVLDFLIYFRRGILDGRISKKQQIVFWTMVAGVLLAYFPYLTDYFSIGDDSTFHWGRIAYLADELQMGQTFPVRMESTWLYGHGYAVPIFYGDLFLYIPAFFRLLGFSVMNAYKIFVFLVLVFTVIIAYYSLKQCLKDEYAALFGSIVYLLIPYHLLNIYSRGAVGEYLAMTFLPLVCCGMYLLYTEDVTSKEYKKYKWFIIGGMSAVLQSHLITLEMTAVLMLVFCIIFLKKTFRKQTFLQLLSATSLVLLINAWFWVPMLYMLNMDVYHLQTVVSEKGQSKGVLFASLFQFLPNKGSVDARMWNVQTGLWHYEPRQIGTGTVMLFLLYTIWRRQKRKQRDITDKACLLFAVASVITVIMSTRYFPWDAIAEIPIIGYMAATQQFPWRWLSPAALFSAFFAAFFFRQIKETGGPRGRTALGIVAAVTLMSAVYHVNSIAYDSKPIWLYNVENMGTAGVAGEEYLPEGVTKRDFYYHKPVAEEDLQWSDYEKRGTVVSITLANTADEVRYLELPLIGYKGYGIKTFESESNQTGNPSISEEKGAHGDLRLEIPARYQGRIQVSYQGFAIFRAVEAVSLIGLLAAAVIYLYEKREKK